MAAKYKLIYLAPASADILKIVDFYAKQAGLVYARNVYSAIKEQLGQLQRFPPTGQLHPTRRSSDPTQTRSFRRWVIENWS